MLGSVESKLHWYKDVEMHGCRDTGGSMPCYWMHEFVDAGCIVCRDAEIHGYRDTGGSMPCYWMHGYLDAGCIASWMQRYRWTLMHGFVDAGCIGART